MVIKELWMQIKSGIKPNPNVAPYALIIKSVYDYASVFLVCPMRVYYEEGPDGTSLVVRKCHWSQQVGCIVVQILSTLSAVKSMVQNWRQLMSDTGYIVSYFDFMTGLFLNMYLYTLLYMHWFQLDRIQNYVDRLQHSPLNQFCTFSRWKSQCLSNFFWWLTIYLSYIWLLIVYGFQLTNWRESIDEMARQIFWMDEQTTVPLILGVFGLIGRFYQALFIMVPPNAIGPLNLFTISFVAYDFFVTVLKRNLHIDEVLMLYREYKKTLACANLVLSSWCIHFVCVTMSYHSLHLFDALNVQDSIWKISTYIYLLYLVNFMALPSRSFVLALKMKRWLWENENFMKLEQREMALILYDMSYWTKALAIKGGNFFKITPEFAGTIFQELCSFSMLNIMSQRRPIK